ncbi:MAG: alpha/beta fold hydrolase, partial [Bacteroidia bacterium]|nr:alpha/beta fold hydrolase [Bacteroidia bacterium]
MLLHSNILGEGKPMVILHGFLGMSDNWKTLGKRFSEEGFEVHLVDQRNHGRSFHDAGFNYDLLIEDLKFYCEHFKIDDMVLIGHSMGGKTAMFFSAEYGSLVSKMIIADISPRYYPVHHTEILEGLKALHYEGISSRKQADDYLSNFISDYGTRLFLLKNLYWVEKGQLGFRMNLKVLSELVEEIGEALPMYYKFNGDALFLKGDRSEYITDEDESLIKSHFPNATIQTISNSGHWLHAENPEEFFKAVMN